jgi:hypothetical protein
MDIIACIEYLGREARDRVTNFQGVVTSISFDLYGCVQAIVTPKADESGSKLEDSRWFDVKRLTLGIRVMDVPAFEKKKLGEEIGSQEKPPFERR